jgi:hypothetical protein
MEAEITDAVFQIYLENKTEMLQKMNEKIENG